jgi:hypothetical protein
MRALLKICLMGSAIVVLSTANAQVVRCDDGAFREASTCPGARQSGAVTNRETRTAPGPVAVPAQNRGENAGQYMGRMEVYCVSQPPTQRAECRVQANAQTRLYSANYEAAAIPLQTREALKAMGAKPSPLQPGDCNPRTQRCN